VASRAAHRDEWPVRIGTAVVPQCSGMSPDGITAALLGCRTPHVHRYGRIGSIPKDSARPSEYDSQRGTMTWSPEAGWPTAEKLGFGNHVRPQTGITDHGCPAPALRKRPGVNRSSRPLVAVLAGLFAVSALAACETSERGPEAPTKQTVAPVHHNTVVRVDAQSGRVEAVIPVGPDPLLLTVASGRVWTLNLGDGTLSRVAPVTNAATTVRIGEAVGFASNGPDLWVAVDGNRLVRIDGGTGTQETSLRLGRRQLFALRDAGFPAIGHGSIWLTVPVLGRSDFANTLWRLDPKTGRVITRIEIGPDPLPPLIDGRYIWIVSLHGLSRIDVRTQEVRIVVPSARPGVGPWGVAAGAGSVWMGQSYGEVWRLDPPTGRPEAKVPVDGPVRGVAFGGGFVWVTTEASLLSIDPATNEVARTIPLTNPEPDLGPIGVAYLDGSVWVSVE
jgi:outer membrane protein assembly factor BamB